jgi:hypothetical protein
MPRISNTQRLRDVHGEALRRFDAIQSALRDERLQCLQDRRFYSIAGAQWEGPLEQQYENKPKFEVNKIALAVQRLVNEYRNNRVTVDFVSKDGSPTAMADVCNKLFRADEQDSTANEAYDNAFEEAIGGGFGAWRLKAVYEDDEDPDNDHQRIRIEPIYDADTSVFFDLQAKRQDKADATHAFVLYSITRDAYIDQYGDDPTTWPKEIYETMFDWSTPDVVYIAEYYCIEEVNEKQFVYRALDGSEDKYLASDFEKDPELEQMLAAIGSEVVRERTIKRKRVRKYLMSGGKVLEDHGYIAGKCIPIVPVYGKRWFVDNVERCMGIVRLAKDAQRLKNMQLSKLGEISALSSIEKPIMTPEQVAGHQVMWSEDNLKNYPYLLINPVTGPDGSMQVSGPTAYTKSPVIPPAMAALLQVTEQDMNDILGNQQEGDKIVSNISGDAMEMVQQRLASQAFLYISNYAKAVQRCGEIWLSMAKDIYVEPRRRMKGLNEQGKTDTIELLKPTMGENGEVEYENDLSTADFDVVADVGPSFATQRAATRRSLLGMMQFASSDPQTQKILLATLMQNLEGDGVQEVADFMRRELVTAGVVKPTDEEAAALAQAAQNQQPDPNVLYIQAVSEKERAQAQKAQADSVNALADAQLKRAKVQETLAKMSLDDRRIVLDTMMAMNEMGAQRGNAVQ